MGYYVNVNGGTFNFDKGATDKIIKAIKDGIKTKKITQESYVDFNTVLEAESIEDVLGEFRFELCLNKDDRYEIDYFSGEKFGGYEESLFKCIAPYVNDGYIEYLGEDGERWRYIFKNGRCREVYPEIIWEE